MSVPASKRMSNGVKNGATSVAIAVTVTDNARFARAR